MANQECIAITQCPFTKQLIASIKYSSNEDEKEAIQQFIKSRSCGGLLDETVCCDKTQGKNLLYNLMTRKYSGRNSCCNKSLFMKQKCQFQIGIAQYKNAATPLRTRGINTTHQHFQMRYITLIYLKGLKSYQPSNLKCVVSVVK